MPLLWPKFSSKGIHKTNKDLNFGHAEIEYEADIYSKCFDNGINKKELIQARDTLIFLLQTLGFLVNKNKSVLHPCQILQFLAVEINSKEMSVSLPQEKKHKIISQCQSILKEKSVFIRELTQVLGRLSSTATAVLAAPLQYRAIQRQ